MHIRASCALEVEWNRGMGRRIGFPILECKQHITTYLHMLYGQKLKKIPSVFYVKAVSSILL